MIRLIITVLAVSGAAFFNKSAAQERNDLKGPEAKNYKPWKNKSTKKLITYRREILQGPDAKNQKPWKKEVNQYQEVAGRSNHNLQGPRAKNHKPWQSKKK
ncbi:hypothetical protein [Fulvivirga ligni]|uniref:hypothetical protein n=1 Tax=Fulvivirga ligni TaxID=2904246 RepID=UPI001F46DB99|nr:hypothetical protein [Fulvivirga ligni]UII23164.1 hypothetical protein LVD16_07985 [Fulvivirga ligni]